jgi:hypothetical protein
MVYQPPGAAQDRVDSVQICTVAGIPAADADAASLDGGRPIVAARFPRSLNNRQIAIAGAAVNLPPADLVQLVSALGAAGLAPAGAPPADCATPQD